MRFGIVCFLSMCLLLAGGGSKNSESKVAEQRQPVKVAEEAKPAETQISTKPYETVYVVKNKRFDKQYEAAHVPGAQNIPQAKLREALVKLDKDKPTVTYCNKGVTGNAAQNILLQSGFREVYNLSGGHKHYQNQKQQKK